MASNPARPYKSPPHKLIRFFEKSRDQWKTKCCTAKASIKRLQHRVRYLEASKAEWKQRAQALEAEVAHLQSQAAVSSPKKKPRP